MKYFLGAALLAVILQFSGVPVISATVHGLHVAADKVVSSPLYPKWK